jgi:hypothetical protein
MSDKIRNELTALGFEIKDTKTVSSGNSTSSIRTVKLIATFNASVYRKDIPLGLLCNDRVSGCLLPRTAT